MKYLFVCALAAFILMQCASPKNACIDITSIEQKHEKLSKRLLKKIGDSRESGSLANANEKHKDLPRPQATMSDVLLESQLILDLNDEYETSALLGNTRVRSQTQIKKRIGQLKNYLDEHYLSADTVIVNPEAQADFFVEQHARAKKLAITSFVTSLSFWIPYLGFVAFVTSIVTGVISLKRYKKTPNKKGRGYAVAGLVIDGILVALALFLVVLLIAFFANGSFV